MKTKEKKTEVVQEVQPEIMYENEVTLRGFVVHKYEANKATVITISTGTAGKVPNYPKTVCFGKHIETAKDINVGDNITVKCNMQSSRRKKDEEEFYTQSLFVDEISKSPKLMEEEFGLTGKKYAPPLNEAKFAGIVKYIYSPAKNMVKFTLLTEKNGRKSYIVMTYFTRDVGQVMESIRVNDNVCVVGSIQTNKKIKGDEVLHYENIIVSDLEKVS